MQTDPLPIIVKGAPDMARQEEEGLDGVVAASTRLSLVDGEAGHLLIAGYAVEDIAPKARFEQLTHLLWYGKLPSAQELKSLSFDLASRRRLPSATVALLREAAAHSSPTMDALRMAVATLSLGRREAF